MRGLRLGSLTLAGLMLASCGHPYTHIVLDNQDSQEYVVVVSDTSVIDRLSLPPRSSGIAAQASYDLRVTIEILNAATCETLGAFDTAAPGALVTVHQGALGFSDDLSGASAAELRATTRCTGET